MALTASSVDDLSLFAIGRRYLSKNAKPYGGV